MFNFLTHILVEDAAYQAAQKIYTDNSDNEPLLTEEALVHDKSEHCRCYIIHFYIADRDTVVNCEVPRSVWHDIPKKTRGSLTHRGGQFRSFESQGILYR